MIVNINYKASTDKSNVKHLEFRQNKPQHFLYIGVGFKIIIFKTGKCRIMGCRKPITETLPFNIIIERLQSVTLSCDLGFPINLMKLSVTMAEECVYEPEIFPTLRYTKYNPLCVNVFSTGKIVILGVKTLDCSELENSIITDIMLLMLDDMDQ